MLQSFFYSVSYGSHSLCMISVTYIARNVTKYGDPIDQKTISYTVHSQLILSSHYLWYGHALNTHFLQLWSVISVKQNIHWWQNGNMPLISVITMNGAVYKSGILKDINMFEFKISIAKTDQLHTTWQIISRIFQLDCLNFKYYFEL